MSRGSRRKTLSHSEIENFLSEINVDQKQGLNKDSSAALAGNYSLSQPLEVVCTDPMRTEVQAIREFCRATFQTYRQGKHLEPTKELCDVGRKILSGSSYPILSTRLLRPENYLYPASSLEGKKSLLLSLSPMLSDAEEQRQKETSACESFTRCSSGKGKGKYACYVYTDVDVKCQVDFPEYEKRYMLYIGQNKKTYAKSTPMSPSLNYLTLQHRQRKTERQSLMPKRNLQSILDGQMGEENRRISNSPNQSVTKLLNKPKIEPVKLDDSTMELVTSLLKPRGNINSVGSSVSTRRMSSAMDVVAVLPLAQSAALTEDAMPLPDVVVAAPTPPKKSPLEVVRSPFAALIEVTAPVPSPPTLAAEPVSEVDAVEEDSASMDVYPETEANEFIDDAVNSSGGGTNDRKRKHGRSARLLARRGTLSPASVRAMLLDMCDPEPVLSPQAVPEPLESSVFSDNCTAADSELLVQGVTTPVKSKPSTPFGSPAVHDNTAEAAEAPHTSPFSIRTALELRRTSSKPKAPSPVVIQLRAEVEAVQSEHEQESESETLCTEYNEHAKKLARSGSPSAATVTRTASPAASIFLPSPVSTVAEELAVEEEVSVNIEEPRSTSEVVVGGEVAVEMELTTTIDASDLPAVGAVGAVEISMEIPVTIVIAMEVEAVSEMNSSEMEVIEDFGRELDSMLCDVSCMVEPSSPFVSSSRVLSPTPSVFAAEDVAAVAEVEEEVQEVAWGSPSKRAASPVASSPAVSDRAVSTPVSPVPSLPTECAEHTPVEAESEEMVAAEETVEAGQTVEREVDIVVPDVTSPLKTPSIVSAHFAFVVEEEHVQVESAMEETPVVNTSDLDLAAIEAFKQDLFSSPQKAQVIDQARTPASVHVSLADLPPLSAPRLSPSNSATPGSVLSSATKASVAPRAARMPIIPPTPPSVPRSRSALSPKVAHFSPFGCISSKSGHSSKASSPGDRNTSMDDSCLMFCEHDEDLEAFEMLESMVEKEFEGGALTWDFSGIARPASVEEEMPLTAHSTESSPAAKSTTRVEESGRNAPLEGVCDVCEDSKPSVSPAPHPRTPQKKTPEQRSAGSSERKRRGLTFIPRYAVSPAALSHALNSSALNSSALDESTCTALAVSETEVSLVDIVLPVVSTAPAEPVSSSSSAATSPSLAQPSSSPEESIYPESMDLAAAQARAKARYEERLQVARWQYEWELTSAQMAHSLTQRHAKQ